jgi:hypothetical protein
VHNFIRIHDPEDLLEDEPLPDDGGDGAAAAGNEDDNQDRHGRLQNHVSAAERGRATARRDLIAKAMWHDYKLRRR